MASNGKQPPTGVQMMLRALGIEFDPKAFSQVGAAVIDVRDRLARIEEKLDRALKIFPKEFPNDGNESESAGSGGSDKCNVGSGTGGGEDRS